MAPYNAKASEMQIMNKVGAKLKELGMYTFVRWNYVFIAPPLIVTKEQVDEGLAIISEALKIADEYVNWGSNIVCIFEIKAMNKEQMFIHHSSIEAKSGN